MVSSDDNLAPSLRTDYDDGSGKVKHLTPSGFVTLPAGRQSATSPDQWREFQCRSCRRLRSF